jgi:hypothetical protein
MPLGQGFIHVYHFHGCYPEAAFFKAGNDCPGQSPLDGIGFDEH